MRSNSDGQLPAANVANFMFSGMRCIGVATSLSQARMADHAPDAVRADISAVALQDLVGLQRTHKSPAPGVTNLQVRGNLQGNLDLRSIAIKVQGVLQGA